MGKTAGRGSALGISLVDVCAAVATVGVMMVLLAVAVPRWTDSARNHADVTSLQRLLRDAQQEAIDEGRPRCVEDQTWKVLRGACGGGRGGVTFFADGSATPRTLSVGPDTLTVDPSGSTAIS